VRNFLDSVKIGGRNVCREPYWKKLGRIYIGKGLKYRPITFYLQQYGLVNTFLHCLTHSTTF
ncbi:MAG: hypothetical protein DYH05_11965, partial [Acidobacteria bacterium ACB1]|nr:hypothetical protein [Acidobacteria bacterium ACB1]